MSYRPIIHRSKNYFHFTKVEWPIIKYGEITPSRIAVIEIGDSYRLPSGYVVRVVSMFDGKLYPLINYQTEKGKIQSASIHWFAHMIANKSEKI